MSQLWKWVTCRTGCKRFWKQALHLCKHIPILGTLVHIPIPIPKIGTRTHTQSWYPNPYWYPWVPEWVLVCSLLQESIFILSELSLGACTYVILSTEPARNLLIISCRFFFFSYWFLFFVFVFSYWFFFQYIYLIWNFFSILQILIGYFYI